MTVFLWVMLVCYVIVFCKTIYRLGSGNYPIIKAENAADDVFYLLITLGMGIWVVILLFF